MNPEVDDEGVTSFHCDRCTALEIEQPSNIETYLAECRAILAEAKTVRV